MSDVSTPRADDTLAAEFVRAAEFRRALRRFLRQTERTVTRSGLTPQRYQLLLFIKASPAEAATIGDLADAFQLAQSTITELVQRTEDAGLIQRAQSADDGRVVLVSLSDEGERRLLSAFLALRAERDLMAEAFRQVDRRFRAALRGTDRTNGGA